MRLAGSLAGLALVVVCVSLLLAAGSASAAELSHVGTFGSANQPTFSEPTGVVVDQATNEIYVVNFELEGLNHVGTVSRWHEDGTPSNFSVLGTNVIDGKGNGSGPGSGGTCTPPSTECDETPQNGILGTLAEPAEAQIAIDESGGPADGDIYVTDSTNGAVDIFSAEGEYLGQLTEYKAGPAAEGALTPLVEAGGVAIGPDGSVYVSEFGGLVHKYEPQFNPVFNTENTANLGANEPVNLAAGAAATAGFVFPIAFGGVIQKVNETTGATEYTIPGPNLTDSIDPVNGHLFAASGSSIVEWDASGATSAIEVTNTTLGASAMGVGIDGSTGNVYVTEAGNSNVEVYSAGVTPTPQFRLDVAVTGEGEVNSSPAGIDGCEEAGGICSAEFEEGKTVTLTATAVPGSSEFGEWTGACSDTGACEVTMSEAESVGVVFNAVPPPSEHPLTVFVTGRGSVSADSGTISGCTSSGGFDCHGEYEGTVTLTESPEPGYVFAGWVGCRHKSPTECEVTVNAEKEIYAVFLREGTEGQAGEPGAPGLEGIPGATGATGATGAQGATGVQGPPGPAGPGGAKGDAGATGPQGPAGARGPAGAKGKVVCKVQQKKGGQKISVTCTVQYEGAKAKGGKTQWRLVHAGHVVRRGSVNRHEERIHLCGLERGRYRLHIAGQKGSRSIVVG